MGPSLFALFIYYKYSSDGIITVLFTHFEEVLIMLFPIYIPWPRNLTLAINCSLYKEIDGNELVRIESAIDTIKDEEVKKFIYVYFRERITDWVDLRRFYGWSRTKVSQLLKLAMTELRDPRRIHLIKHGGAFSDV